MKVDLVDFEKLERESDDCKKFRLSVMETIDKLEAENEQLHLEAEMLKQENFLLKEENENMSSLEEDYRIEKKVSKRLSDESISLSLEIEGLKDKLKKHEEEEDDPDAEIENLIEYED